MGRLQHLDHAPGCVTTGGHQPVPLRSALPGEPRKLLGGLGREPGGGRRGVSGRRGAGQAHNWVCSQGLGQDVLQGLERGHGQARLARSGWEAHHRDARALQFLHLPAVGGVQAAHHHEGAPGPPQVRWAGVACGVRWAWGRPVGAGECTGQARRPHPEQVWSAQAGGGNDGIQVGIGGGVVDAQSLRGHAAWSAHAVHHHAGCDGRARVAGKHGLLQRRAVQPLASLLCGAPGRREGRCHQRQLPARPIQGTAGLGAQMAAQGGVNGLEQHGRVSQHLCGVTEPRLRALGGHKPGVEIDGQHVGAVRLCQRFGVQQHTCRPPAGGKGRCTVEGAGQVVGQNGDHECFFLLN